LIVPSMKADELIGHYCAAAVGDVVLAVESKIDGRVA
jgi:hypothetical protein